MTLEQSIRQLAAEGTREALERFLPELLARVEVPVDPEQRLTYQEAAELLRLPEGTVRVRETEGALPFFVDGKRKYILRKDVDAYNARLRAQAQFKRDQARNVAPHDVDPEIAKMLALSPAGVSKKKSPGRNQG